jgi:hypothetical protein
MRYIFQNRLVHHNLYSLVIIMVGHLGGHSSDRAKGGWPIGMTLEVKQQKEKTMIKAIEEA